MIDEATETIKVPTLNTPLIFGKANPQNWLALLKKRSGMEFIPEAFCGKCKRKMSTAEIFQGFDKGGSSKVFCPLCHTGNPATLTIKKPGSKKKTIQLLGPNSTAEQLKITPPTTSTRISDIPAPRLNAFFYTGRSI